MPLALPRLDTLSSSCAAARRIALALLAGGLICSPTAARELKPDFRPVVYSSADGCLQITASVPEELKRGVQLPDSLTLMDSMNNVDMIRHTQNGVQRYYLAFRTAPNHFASTRTLMHVLSSANGRYWQTEDTIHLGADMREPRFLSFKGRLFFYFFKGGTDPFAFEPERMYVSEHIAGGWSLPQPFYEPGYVPWRARVYGDQAYLSTYYGRGLYGAQDKAAVRLLVSQDGLDWKPVSEQPQLTIPGAEEPEFDFDEKGDIWGTIRLENQGGMLFHARHGELGSWETIKLKDKYDSALMLKHKNNFYLIARRNVDGTMDKAPAGWPDEWRKWINLGRYWVTTKRTALYRFDTDTKTITPLFDFPSHGDTAFPALAPIDENRYWFINYSSPLGIGRDDNWVTGQLRQTRLYESVLSFDKD